MPCQAQLFGGGGLLGGILGKIKEGRRAGKIVQSSLEKYRHQLEAYESFCKEIGEKPADVALAWILQNPGITSPIVGPRTIEQLTGILRAFEIVLSEEHNKKLDEIWPGPGNQAPEAYAW